MVIGGKQIALSGWAGYALQYLYQRKNEWVSLPALLELKNPETGARSATHTRRLSDCREALAGTYYSLVNRKEWEAKICHSFYCLLDSLLYEIQDGNIVRKQYRERASQDQLPLSF